MGFFRRDLVFNTIRSLSFLTLFFLAWVRWPARRQKCLCCFAIKEKTHLWWRQTMVKRESLQIFVEDCSLDFARDSFCFRNFTENRCWWYWVKIPGKLVKRIKQRNEYKGTLASSSSVTQAIHVFFISINFLLKTIIILQSKSL